MNKTKKKRAMPITRAKLFDLACMDKRYSIETQMGDIRFDVVQREEVSRDILRGVRCYHNGQCHYIRPTGPKIEFLEPYLRTAREAAVYLDLISWL
jgi:hypothetical protein